jgi:hypothetical protein
LTQYRCYFITAANKAEESFLIEAPSPQGAADEAMTRCTNPNFVSVEIWQGAACVLTKRTNRPVVPNAMRFPKHVGDV